MGHFAAVSVLCLFLGSLCLGMGHTPDWDPEETPGQSSASPKLAVLLQPYTGSRSGPDTSSGPELMLEGLSPLFTELAVQPNVVETIALPPEEERQYGEWHRVGLANGHLGRRMAPLLRDGNFILGLLGNCNGLLGMLAGAQNGGGPKGKPAKVGLVWLDAHGDFNTPETTLSGMLGGMPVAVAAGKCLFRLRLKSGLDPALPTRHIVMMGLRDVDPLEQVLIDESFITCVSTEDLIEQTEALTAALEMLARQVDVIYVHIDLDVLDAEDIPGHSFEIPEGPTAEQLGGALRIMLREPKVGALGIASFPTDPAGRERCLSSLTTLVQGAWEGLRGR
jgi:arginase